MSQDSMPELMAADRHFRSDCSISRMLDLMGDKWTLLIIRDLLWHNTHTFQDLESSVARITSSILSDRLNRLRRWNLVRRSPYQDRPVRYRYELTEAALTLEPVLLAMMHWGHEHLGGGLFDPVQAADSEKDNKNS